MDNIPQDHKFIPRFVKGVLATGTGTIVAMMTSFISVMIAARFVPKDQLGIFILMQLVIFFLILISDFGLNVSLIKFIASEKDAEKLYVSTIFLFKIVFSLLVCCAVLILKNYLGSFFKMGQIGNFAFVVAFLFLLEMLNQFFLAILQGKHRYRQIGMAQVLLSGINLVFVIVFLVIFKWGLWALIWSRTAALVIILPLQVFFFSEGNISLRFDVTSFKKIFLFGFPLWINSILTFIFRKIDTVLINIFLTPVNVANYGVVSKIPDGFIQVHESYRTVYFPHMSGFFSKGENARAEHVLNHSIRLISFFSLLFTLAIILFRNEIVTALFSARYLSSAPVLGVLMVSLCIGLIGNNMGTALVAAGYSKLPAMINMVDATATVVGNIILIPRFGIIGAAYAALLARILTNPVILFFLIRRNIAVDFISYIKIVGAFIVCLVFEVTVYPKFLLLRVLWLILFICFGILLKSVRREDVKKILIGLRIER